MSEPAEIIPLFNPEARVLVKLPGALKYGVGIGSGRQWRDAEVERLVGLYRVALRMNAMCNATLKIMLDGRSMDAFEKQEFLDALSIMSSTGTMLRQRIDAAARTKLPTRIQRKRRRKADV
jgi:hypothetical protein